MCLPAAAPLVFATLPPKPRPLSTAGLPECSSQLHIAARARSQDATALSGLGVAPSLATRRPPTSAQRRAVGVAGPLASTAARQMPPRAANKVGNEAQVMGYCQLG